MEMLLSILLFAAFGAIFVFGNMLLGKLARPSLPNDQKAATYECGEPTIGTSWVQFDLRFYIIALVYLVFDVEVALFYPWAVTYGDATAIGQRLAVPAFTIRAAALTDMLFFFGVLMVGFAYLWRFGYLDWVRSAATTSLNAPNRQTASLQSRDLSRVARIDPETIDQTAEARSHCLDVRLDWPVRAIRVSRPIEFFGSSSMVEQSAVNRLVVGSSPTCRVPHTRDAQNEQNAFAVPGVAPIKQREFRSARREQTPTSPR